MDTDELGLRRSQMGHAAGLMLRDGPSTVIEAGQGYWLAQSGVASVDMNMALVSSRVNRPVFCIRSGLVLGLDVRSGFERSRCARTRLVGCHRARCAGADC